MLLFGLVLFSATYFGMAYANSMVGFAALFITYGLYAAATEGISKAWISNLVGRMELATAIGSFSGFQSIAALIASSWAGFIWYQFGSTVLFIGAGIITLLVAWYIYLKIEKQETV